MAAGRCPGQAPGLTAPKSLSHLPLLETGVSVPRWVWAPLSQRVAENVGAWVPISRVPSCVWCFLQIEMRSWFFWLRFILKTGPRPCSPGTAGSSRLPQAAGPCCCLQTVSRGTALSAC